MQTERKIHVSDGWTLFLDRDGVINKKIDSDYVRDWSSFYFLIDIPKIFQILNTIFSRVIIISNQQGIGKKLMTISDLINLHNIMINTIQNVDGEIDSIYCCPHLQENNCNCRKPNPGMLQRSIQQFPDIQLKKSIFIGDSLSDIRLGLSQGLVTVYLGDSPRLQEIANYHFPDLKMFMRNLIINK
ncbi:MAG: HAD-IIIA family hydrolase [Candidatus Marinimicrobia bacterium]|jgi:D-glycero-D-manno-heptose 1,7-bisphosphate phosphatase|nr:HAD-IIIA family hydrolase [Candidatus Neomarinimicrobiota bacterium]MBT3633453.1 HAD-IIIA family hydrolase [Candidatus Neomarinimicrobiota bacterium]MBT3681596.1 HAD-IIIA family hydrolase [Candidatus Neomarinimicrobiota bacterium]MBT3758437.1 HAD-IIIA family hydrolase [Candidatus Neomarinimicrobiota bacterium]MBT3894909.1 HAD-IIIA family hydrolase [Candidatus Neomarinimicrobiota bacterium]